jgi:hypothetical protein
VAATADTLAAAVAVRWGAPERRQDAPLLAAPVDELPPLQLDQ